MEVSDELLTKLLTQSQGNNTKTQENNILLSVLVLLLMAALGYIVVTFINIEPVTEVEVKPVATRQSTRQPLVQQQQPAIVAPPMAAPTTTPVPTMAPADAPVPIIVQQEVPTMTRSAIVVTPHTAAQEDIFIRVTAEHQIIDVYATTVSEEIIARQTAQHEATVQAWLDAPPSTATPLPQPGEPGFNESFQDAGCSPFIGYLPGHSCYDSGE
jgi:hypothetical protein